ncbi:ABC transporter substrate-binding protein [Acidovorax sp. SRB_14]|uniref:tripartite tricarboxylate transporter substrate binding protein n=1 Tax=unclassified Acidovorax TaxID=2684926 RepID=UPI00145D474D|nr:MULTISPECIES: tripartite tricarboxylate transporter substrate binding protein [unclassified Acidovorax]NMM75815.1 ABC transporter substrate-binding protein [Acidovorax sp. SRB_24]NMM81819.1 ABC transporter substrate-binding protein [Acidovorax sp. SRB_14]NMM90055.1 ABC transporter substrate-binding protein [Rhodococcus sp. SRB_17]
MSKPHASLHRRHLLAAAAAGALTAFTGTAVASAWPDKLVKIVVAFPPGGPTDTAARIVAQKLGERLGQSVIVENRPGASGSIGTAAFIKSPADGYTLSMFGMPALLAPLLFNNNAYDVRKDFLPVATVYDLPMAVVINPRVLPNVTTLPQLIAHAKASKTPLNYTSSGTGSFGHLSMEQLKDLGGFDMQHIPYRGSAPAVTDLIGGQIPVMFADVVAALPHIQAGKLRAIAVSSNQAKLLLPGVKSVAEQGFAGFDADTWGGLIAPLGTPRAVVDRLNKELKVIMADPELQQKMIGAGAVANYQTGETMRKRLLSDYDRWSKIAKDKNISAL